VVWPGERKIEDFVYNTVQVEIRDRMAKPIAEGGSSLVYLAKTMMTFVSSLDFASDRRQEERV
jgi:serine/threonine protein kinase